MGSSSGIHIKVAFHKTKLAMHVRQKVKVTLEQAMKAQKGSRGIAVLFL
jgi:hypothetical protein